MFLGCTAHSPLPFGVTQGEQTFSECTSLYRIEINQFSIEFFIGKPTDDRISKQDGSDAATDD